MDFEERLSMLDASLFDAIPSQSTEGDRVSWLALQKAVRAARTPYAYLEIGSHLGGSLQQHVVDPACGRIYSIDKRPGRTPDARGFVDYASSTRQMLDSLARLSPQGAGKVRCFDCDAAEVDASAIVEAPDFCFIDGMHTKKAVLSDFEFCRRVCAPAAVIAFHDHYIIYPALRQIIARLERQGEPFAALTLGGGTFALFFGGHPAARSPDVLRLAREGDGMRWVESQWRINAARHFAAYRMPTLLEWSRRARRVLGRFIPFLRIR